jgi:nucleotide-binding universal stress UspA family protein
VWAPGSTTKVYLYNYVYSSTSMICNRCHTPINVGNFFCTRCGQIVPDLDPEHTATLERVRAASEERVRKQRLVSTSRTTLRSLTVGILLMIAFCCLIIIGFVGLITHSRVSRAKGSSTAEQKVKDAKNTVLPVQRSNTQANSKPVAEVTSKEQVEPLTFGAAEADDREIVKNIPSSGEVIQDEFKIARAELCRDGVTDLIVMGTGSDSCGSRGCETIVLQPSAKGYSVVLDQNLPDTLAIASQPGSSCKAIVAVDENGRILKDDVPGTPLFGRELRYQLSISKVVIQ